MPATPGRRCACWPAWWARAPCRPPPGARGGRGAGGRPAPLPAGLRAAGRTSVTEPAASRDHAERLLPCFGVPVRRTGLTVVVAGGARPTPFDMIVPGDP